MLTQVDLDGYSLSLMDSIIDHQRDPSQAILIEDKYITTKSGQKWLRKTMKEWKLLIKWKDKSKAWINLADMKEAHPVETVEYARAKGISNEPAFAWWVPYTLRKREVILAAVKNQIRKTTHKYGIKIPRDVKHAHEIDLRMATPCGGMHSRRRCTMLEWLLRYWMREHMHHMDGNK